MKLGLEQDRAYLTPFPGELICSYDTIIANQYQNIKLFIGDGSTPGGVEIVGGDATLTQHSIAGSYHNANNWKIFYSNGSGEIVELDLGADGTFLKSNGIDTIPTWETISASATYTGTFPISVSGTTISHIDTAGNKHIPSGGATGQILKWSAAGTAVWGAETGTTYTAGTAVTISAGNEISVNLGTTASTVAAGNHTHSLLTRGTGLTGSNYNGSAATTFAIDFGTSTNQVARGDHTHTGLLPAAHNLVDTTNHPVSGLTTGHVLRASGATSYAFSQLSYSDLTGTLPTHTHAAADTTSGQFAIARIPTGTTGTTVAIGNDSRFHVHAETGALSNGFGERFVSTLDPDPAVGVNGDMWLQYD